MDILSITGAVLALIALLGGSILKGTGLSALWSPAAFVIVIVGTIAATLLQTTMSTAKRGAQMSMWILKTPQGYGKPMIGQLVEWSNVARKQGLLALEAEVEKQTDPFLKKGLQMLVDGVEPDAIRSMLEIDVHAESQRDLAAAKMFEAAGIYSPTLGIIGAVLGLMAVMQNLADPSKLGAGIAAAFTATVYGIGAANLLLLPMANKIKNLVNLQSHDREMLIEGLVAIADGENPRNIEVRLNGYVH